MGKECEMEMKEKGKKKKWVKRVIALVVIVLLFVIFSQNMKKPVTYRAVEASKGDVTVVVSGTGTIKATNARKEISKVNARVEEVYYHEGEEVQKGDVIAKLDSSDYEMTVQTQASSVKQAQISKNSVDRQMQNLKIVAPSDGYIANLNVSEGSYVVTNTKVADITTPYTYELSLQFLASETNKIEVGNYANVFLTDSYSYIDGVVTYVGSGKKVLQNGSNVIDVIITVENSHYVLDGLGANATITTATGAKLTSASDSKFANARSAQVLSGSTGTIMRLFVKNGSEVKKGDILAELENKDLLSSAQTSAESLQNMYEQLTYAKSKLEDYAISASIDGVITAQTLKVGDWVQAGSLVSTVSDMEEFEFLIPVDELDIGKMTLDSKVLVTLDALPETLDNPILGRVSKLPLEGVSTNGVTDYYVTISIPYVEGLRISMNASADIVVVESLDTIRVPVECVSKEDKKYYVQVLKGEETEKREVEVGVQNSSYYEIKSGIAEGEQVIIPQSPIMSLF